TVRPREPSNMWSPSFSVRAATTTFAPSAAKSSAIAWPMPRLAPVTIATLPSSLPISSSRPAPPLRGAGSGGASGRPTKVSRVSVDPARRAQRRQLRHRPGRHPGLALPRGRVLRDLAAIDLVQRTAVEVAGAQQAGRRQIDVEALVGVATLEHGRHAT